MKYKILIFALTIVTIACSSPNKRHKKQEHNILDNIIRFGDAIQYSQETLLSDIVDSIILVPLETKKDILLRNTNNFIHTYPYIAASSYMFDCNGKHIFTIGRQGNGPCEDYYKPINILYHPVHNVFLSKGAKIIIYDEYGECTGKEVDLFKVGERGNVISGGADNLSEKAIAGDNFVFNKNYESLLWIDVELNKVKSIEIPIAGKLNGFMNENNQYRTLTTNKDSTLFYNYWNDTIYRVSSTDIHPRWIIDMGEEKAPQKIREHYDEIMKQKQEAYLRATRGRMQIDWNEIEAVRLTKGKKAIWAVHETTDYLFFIWSSISPNNHIRNIKDFYLQTGYYNKHTGKTVAVKGSGFVDDILGTGPFIPEYGVMEDNLIKIMWPYELSEFIEQQQANGLKVSPRLLNLHDKMTDEDNPFLMIAHLK